MQPGPYWHEGCGACAVFLVQFGKGFIFRNNFDFSLTNKLTCILNVKS